MTVIDQELDEKNKTDIVEDETVVEDGPVDGDGGETPDWMRDEAPEDDGEQTEETVPASKLASIRGKLKKKLSQRDVENEELKARIQKLENPGAQQAQTQTHVERPAQPLELDYDTTDEYRSALTEYHENKERYDDQMFRDRQSRVTLETNQRREAEDFERSINESYDSHIEKAAILCDANNIDPEKYRAANEKFMDAITRNLPEQARGNGAKDVIKRLGPASAQIAYKFGNNPGYRAKLEGWMQEDPTCLTLMMRLGGEAKLINEPVSRKSKANPPAATATGGSTGTNGAAKFLKEYLAAKKVNHQSAMDIKGKARAAGVDVSDWYAR